jgi:amino acid permease
MYRNLILPAGLLAGTIIGAGVFALPFVFERAGVLAGLLYLLAFGATLTLVNSMYAEVIIKTEETHRFVGYVKTHLGNFSGKISIATSIVGLLLSMVVYLILASSFIGLFAPSMPGAQRVLIFWLIAALTVFLKAGRMAVLEFWVTTAIIAIILAVFFLGIGGFAEKAEFLPLINPAFIFLPYGAVLFSLSGRVAIPSIVNYFREKKEGLNKSKPAIALGIFIPVVVYALFAVGIIGLSGQVSEDSISGLVGNLPKEMLWAMGLLGFFSLWTTYIMLSQEVEKSMASDLKFPKWLSVSAVLFVPALLYFFGFTNFLAIVGVAGGVFIGLEGILIVLMWLKVFRKKSLLAKLLLLVFALGIVYALAY